MQLVQKVLQEHKNYNKMLKMIRQQIKEDAIECLAKGGEGYAKYVMEIFKDQHGAAYTEQGYLEFCNDVRELVASEYGQEC
jgi:hypothetical protein